MLDEAVHRPDIGLRLSGAMRRIAPILLLLLAACREPAAGPPSESAPAPAQVAAAPAAAVDPAQEPAVVAQGATAFGIDLYRRLGQEGRNLFFSPLSLSGAFGMVQAGARGETEAEIAHVLHYTLPRDRLHPALGALMRGMALDQPARRLAVANAVWVQRDYPLLPDYVGLLGENYGAAPEKVDFSANAPEAAARINQWAERNTNGRIRNLLRAGDLSANTRLVLTNTVWMKADWLRQFHPLMTRPGDFFGSMGEAVQIPFMHQQEPFRHLDAPGFQAIELPYVGEELAMIVFLPKARDGLPAFERELEAGRLERWIGQVRAADPEPIDLALPKIRLETRYQLARTLSDMGMPLAFGEGADFSGIDGRGGLFIAKAIHQTFLQVDEEGTEAAAATALVMNESGPRPARIRFHADHPFFFLIRDNRSGALLFMGRIGEPPAG